MKQPSFQIPVQFSFLLMYWKIVISTLIQFLWLKPNQCPWCIPGIKLLHGHCAWIHPWTILSVCWLQIASYSPTHKDLNSVFESIFYYLTFFRFLHFSFNFIKSCIQAQSANSQRQFNQILTVLLIVKVTFRLYYRDFLGAMA